MGDDPTFFCLLGSELIFYNVAKNFTNWTCVSCPPIRPLVWVAGLDDYFLRLFHQWNDEPENWNDIQTA